MQEQLVGTVEELGLGSVRGIGDWAVVNVNGERHAVSRRCRHLRADLANGKLDEEGCLVCPWHQSRYDVTTGRMVVGPQAGFEKVARHCVYSAHEALAATARRGGRARRQGLRPHLNTSSQTSVCAPRVGRNARWRSHPARLLAQLLVDVGEHASPLVV